MVVHCERVEIVLIVAGLLGSSSLRARFGAATRARAVREFDDKIVTEHMLSLYERLLSGGAAVPHSAS